MQKVRSYIETNSNTIIKVLNDAYGFKINKVIPVLNDNYSIVYGDNVTLNVWRTDEMILSRLSYKKDDIGTVKVKSYKTEESFCEKFLLELKDQKCC